jgi:hypothetical protein
MKKNIILFGIFISLMIATYFFQEKRVNKEYSNAKTQDRLVTEDITHLMLPHVEAVKRDNGWWDNDQLLSFNSFNQIIRKLAEIKKIKSINGEWATYFPNPFIFEINHTKWTIGDLSLDRQAFYISRNDEIFLAEIDGESVQLTRDPNEIAAIKLNELVSALSKSKKNLIENQLFRFYPKLPLDRVVLEVDGSLPFELNLTKNTTLPPPIVGVYPHKDMRGKFFSLLTQMNIKEEIPYSEKTKFKKLGSIQFFSEKSQVTWELWLKSKNSADAIIMDSVNKRSFLMVGGTLKLFFVRLQDYWDKKVIPQKDFVSFTRLEANFIQGNKKAQVTILNREPLAFEVTGFKVQQEKMEQLVQFLFNLGPKDQADRVSLLAKTEKMQLLSEEHLRVEVMGQELILWRKQQELIVVNLTQGFKAHFNLLNENFRGTFEDVLK